MYNTGMMQERHTHNHNRLDACLSTVQGIQHMVAKSFLWRFYNNTRKIWSNMDQEFVNCRRNKKISIKYTELEQQFNESIIVFEQYSIIAVLQYS
jgi:hypothetical protein